MSEINNTPDLNEAFEEEMEDAGVVTVPIDATLTHSGEAAEAAAVGAALALKADASAITEIDVNGQGADNQGHILIDGGDIPMGGTDTRKLDEAIQAVEGRTGADIPLTSEVGAPTIAEAVSQAEGSDATSIMMGPESSTSVAQKISAIDATAAAQGAAITALQGKTAETLPVKAGEEETVEEALADRIRTVNGEGPDENGNVDIDTVQMAENLVSELSQTSTELFLLRTSGGDASIEDGDAWLMDLKGNSVHTGYSPRSVAMTVTETGTEGHITAAKDDDDWEEKVSTDGTYTFVFTTAWTLSGSEVNLAEYGITVTGEPVAGDTITVVYAAEVRGTITQANPEKFISTGWNLYNHALGYARVIKYSDSYGFAISGTYTSIKYSETYSGTRSNVTVTSGHFTIPGDGYIWIEGGNSTNTAIWMCWSDWTDAYSGAFSAYVETVIDLSDIMDTYFPYGLLKAGSVADEINLNTGTAISRVERMAYSAENRATAAASGREYEFDEDYIYLARASAVTNTVVISGGYIASDHGMEIFEGSVAVTAETLYGNNLKNKLERDVLTISAQALTDDQKAQVQVNAGVAPMIGIVETGSKASQAISKGQYVIWKGALYTADAAISSGATLAASGSGKNLTAVTGGGLNAFNSNSPTLYQKTVTGTPTSTGSLSSGLNVSTYYILSTRISGVNGFAFWRGNDAYVVCHNLQLEPITSEITLEIVYCKRSELTTP